MAKKLLGLLSFALLSTSVASALTMNATCTGGVGGTSSSGGEVLSTGSGSKPNLNQTLACTGFTLPAGDTLQQVDIFIAGDFQGGAPFSTSGNTLNWTYTVSNVAPALEGGSTETDTGGNADNNWTFLGCANVLVIGDEEDCTTTFNNASSILGSNPSTPAPGMFNISISATWGAGSAGLSGAGDEGYTVSVVYTYSAPVVVPEPASLILIGGGLLGLGFFAQRKRKA
jgi:hypothetical protein